MPLTKLQFKPGINKETTSYSNEGGWNDSDRVRFRFGYPEKIGGWEKYTTNTYLGIARNLHPWTNLSNDALLSVGTNRKYYIESGGAFNDVTPIRLSVRNANNITVSVASVSASATTGTVVVTGVLAVRPPIVGVTVLGNVSVSIAPGVLVQAGTGRNTYIVPVSTPGPILGTTGLGTVTISNSPGIIVPVGT